MSVIHVDKKSINEISIKNIESYLKKEGWKEVGNWGEKASIWIDAKENEIVLPKNKGMRDFDRLFIRLVIALSKIQNKSTNDVFNNMDFVEYDRISISIKDNNNLEHYGTMRMYDYMSKISSAKKMMESIALFSCGNIKRDYKINSGRRRSGLTAEAYTYLDDLKIGQSQKGSFVINIASKLNKYRNTDLFKGHCTFEQIVTKNLVKAVNITVRNAILCVEEKESISIFEESIGQGVSADFLDAIKSLSKHKINPNCLSTINISTKCGYIEPFDKIEDSVVNIEPKYIEVIEEASKSLKSKEPDEPEKIMGIITKCYRGKDDYDGTIFVHGFSSSGREIKSLEVKVDGEEYMDFLSMHEKKSTIRLECLVVKKGYRNTASNVNLLGVIDHD